MLGTVKDALLSDFAKDAEKFSNWCKDVNSEVPQASAHLEPLPEVPEVEPMLMPTLMPKLEDKSEFNVISAGIKGMDSKAAKMVLTDSIETLSTGTNPFRVLAWGAAFVVH